MEMETPRVPSHHQCSPGRRKGDGWGWKTWLKGPVDSEPWWRADCHPCPRETGFAPFGFPPWGCPL